MSRKWELEIKIQRVKYRQQEMKTLVAIEYWNKCMKHICLTWV